MAETTKKTTENAKRKVTVRLPRNQGQNAIQEEFFSVNGRNYLIKRGETVEIPEEVAEVIVNSERAEECAMQYIEGLKKAEEKKRQGIT